MNFPTNKAEILPWLGQFKVVLVCIGLLVLIGLVLFGFDRCEAWKANRDMNGARANLANALADVNAGKQVVANDRVNEAVAVDQVKQAANDVIAASNASNAAKAEANKAVANYVAAKQANVPTGTTEQDLLDKLNNLDR